MIESVLMSSMDIIIIIHSIASIVLSTILNHSILSKYLGSLAIISFFPY